MSDTTLRVFDQGGMYIDSALDAESVQALAPEPIGYIAPNRTDFPPTLADIEKMLDAHPAGLSKAFAQWLVRICRASDARIIQLENEVKLKQSDFNGLVSEWQDLADENRRLKQQTEVDRVVCDSQEKTILELHDMVTKLEREAVCLDNI